MKKRHVAVAAAGLTLVGGFGGFALKAFADGIPPINPLYYSGTLTEGGQLVTGTRAITINVWPDGTTMGTPLCQTVASTANVISGRFRIALATACKTAINQNNGAYVEVIDGATSLGRAPIGAVPYAVEADHAVSADNAADGGGLATQLSLLSNQVHPASAFRAWTETAISIANEGQTIAFDQVDYDLASEYDKTTGVFSPKFTGIYLVTCAFDYSPSASGDFAAVLNDNGTGLGAAEQVYSGQDISPEYSSVVQLSAGDSLTCEAFQNTGANQSLHGGLVGRNVFTAARLY